MNQNNSLAMFENESIGKLMIKFSLPAIASMVVNSIYNIVDQIFIGQGVGMYGNAATNLTFPLVTIAMAIGTLIADGCVAYFSLKLGQKNYDEAERLLRAETLLSAADELDMRLLSGLLSGSSLEKLEQSLFLTASALQYRKKRLMNIAHCAHTSDLLAFLRFCREKGIL